jgi:serine/threonine-protein kinase
MCRFLRFIVEREISGRGRELKEYTIGVEVFDRPSGYDPRIDPIVRVEARRLRAKLEAWYASGEGPVETVIELPKGSYVPRFVPPGTSARPAPAAPVSSRSIAVLPFSNPAGESEAEYLSDGLTQQIIHRLTRVSGLRVLGWQTAERLRARNDLSAVAAELGATHVLTGNVRAAGGRLRIFAQLIEPATSSFVWSESWDRPQRDLFAIEEEIAAAIVNALEGHLGFTLAPARSADAYDLYYRGRYCWNQRTLAGLRESVLLLRQALDLDPGFALAWAGLADSYLIMAQMGISQQRDGIESARAAAVKALEICPELGEAESSLGMISGMRDWQWDEAESHFRRSMQLSPGYATAFYWYSLDYCALRGRFADAEKALDEALILDPLSSSMREGRGYLKMLLRRFDEAIVEYEQVIDFDPSFFRGWTSLARAYILLGDYARAMQHLEKGRTLLGSDLPLVLGAQGQVLALMGNAERARELLGQLREMQRRSFVPETCFATIYIGLGEYAAALDCLRRGAELHELSVTLIGTHPLYDPLRALPEFNELVEKIGCLG